MLRDPKDEELAPICGKIKALREAGLTDMDVPRSQKGKGPAADLGKGGQGQASAQSEGSDSDDSSLGVEGDLSDDDVPPAADAVVPEEDDEEDDVPLVRRSAAEQAGGREASLQLQGPHGDAVAGASGGSGAAATAAPTTPGTPAAPPARSGPPARSILTDRVLKLKPAGSSRKRGQTGDNQRVAGSPNQEASPGIGRRDQDAADAAVTTAAAAARDPRIPDSSSQGTGLVAGTRKFEHFP
ncbi:uncharacterized protein LOC104585548 [Brachypodium distachyon]|uniref:uncharacterized protein LOC104585548 n=1 Tax=Brachypodium distachyon TaxID=15368 RepID=UPI00052FFF09|nr:uncharacterized protein LOC104585548 [Brachypodium distachyon]|eukprot:XP_010240772.1 uncharacterized protein LOC104585548 [Brachypodium distachyon]